MPIIRLDNTTLDYLIDGKFSWSKWYRDLADSQCKPKLIEPIQVLDNLLTRARCLL